MSITIVDVAGADFRTDLDADNLNTKFMERLGMTKRYLPARLAIARSLSMSASADLDLDGNAHGKPIKGDTLFGTSDELLVWLTLIVEHFGQPVLEVKQFRALVYAHWRRGISSLDHDWSLAEQASAGSSVGEATVFGFLKRLAVAAELPAMSGGRLQLDGNDVPPVDFGFMGKVSVPVGEIGEDVDSKEKVVWEMNGKGGSPHSAVMGKSGSGKTVMAAAMLRAIRRQIPVPLIAFDFKGDLFDFTGVKEKTSLGEVFEAEIVEPPSVPVPLNVLTVPQNGDVSINIHQAAQRFRDSFSRLKGSQLGDLQKGRVYEAASRALSSQKVCELYHIRDQLAQIYDENDIRKDGALTMMEELCRFPLFRPDLSSREFFQRSWVIKLPLNVPSDSRIIVTNLLLDALSQYLGSLVDTDVDENGARALRVLCMVDEAHQILTTKLPSLTDLIRMSRSKGGAVMLVSQSPDDFSGEDDEFLDNMGLVASFTTNAKPRAAQRVLGLSRGKNLSGLEEGVCIARVDKATKKIKAW